MMQAPYPLFPFWRGFSHGVNCQKLDVDPFSLWSLWALWYHFQHYQVSISVCPIGLGPICLKSHYQDDTFGSDFFYQFLSYLTFFFFYNYCSLNIFIYIFSFPSGGSCSFDVLKVAWDLNTILPFHKRYIL